MPEKGELVEGEDCTFRLYEGLRLIGRGGARKLTNGLQYIVVKVGPLTVLREVDLREGAEEHRRVEITRCTLAQEATLCAAITQASCQGEEFGQRVCIRDMASEHMTLEMLRVCTSRVRHGDDLCCVAD